MKARYIFILILCIGMVSAQPQVPHRFVGKAYINNVAVPDGTSISVEVQGTGELVGTTTTTTAGSLNYLVDVSMDDSDLPNDGRAAAGNPLVFYISGLETTNPAAGSVFAQVGGNENPFDLYATAGCVIDNNCQDGQWCNGVEQCINYVCVQGSAQSCNDFDPNTIDNCIETGNNQGYCENLALVDPIVSRGFTDDNPNQCSQLTVLLDVQVNDGGSYYAIDEIYPTGWSVINAGDGNTLTPGHIKWAISEGAVDTVYYYVVEVPCESNLGAQVFQGTYMFEENIVEQTIQGDNVVHVQSGCNADSDCFTFTDQCNIGKCNLLTNECYAEPVADGFSCEDGLFCSVGDTCQTGACVAGGEFDCSALDDGCIAGACDESLNECVPDPNLLDGQVCDDGLFCTVDDVCGSGTCGGGPMDCSDPFSCTEDVCDENFDQCISTENDLFCPGNDICWINVHPAPSGCGPGCETEADTNNDGMIDNIEMAEYIVHWYSNTIDMSLLLTAMGHWKLGVGC